MPSYLQPPSIKTTKKESDKENLCTEQRHTAALAVTDVTSPKLSGENQTTLRCIHFITSYRCQINTTCQLFPHCWRQKLILFTKDRRETWMCKRSQVHFTISAGFLFVWCIFPFSNTIKLQKINGNTERCRRLRGKSGLWICSSNHSVSCSDTLTGKPLNFNYMHTPASNTQSEMIEHVRNESQKKRN